MARTKIILDQVGYTYTPPVGPPVRALDGISLAVGEDEFVALVGPSGCGKSTLLYLVGGFLPLREGRILMDGRGVDGPGPDRGIVFQHFALFPWKTVRQNVLYGLEKQGVEPARRRDLAQRFIEMVKLTGFEDV
ncbi:MAG TPA: ATP-binding cassette domain-containing protein, partial [Streptosporangiaceae bacterium]|nr:ATP-binding cassette domain-containing protein [Streptosporangiaceae bacterium]